MKKQLARLRPTRGLLHDAPPWEVSPDFYTRLVNVLIRSGFPQRIGGYRNAYDPPSVAPYHVFNAPMLGVNYWIYAGLEKTYAVAATTHTDISPAGDFGPITKASQWSHTILNGIPVINSSIDAPHYWNGLTASNFAPLPDWPANTLCAQIVAHKYHLFALNITVSGVNNGNKFLWSDAADPGTIPQLWTPAATNEAGSNQLSDTPNIIVTGRTLRDALVIYKRNSAYVVNYVQGNDKFTAQGLWSKAGALSPRAVDDINGKHVVVTEGDIVLNDGYSEPSSIADKIVKRFLFAQLDELAFENLQVLYDHVNREVWVMFPEAGETYNTIALVYSQASDAWGVVELPDVAHAIMGVVDDTAEDQTFDGGSGTFDSESTLFNESTLTSAIDSMVFAKPVLTKLVRFGTTDAVATQALVAKYSMTFDEPERIKFIRFVHLRARNFGTLYVRLGFQMLPTDEITWADEMTITDPAQPIGTFTQGRYISIEIRSDDTDIWDLTGWDMEVEFRGYF